MHIRPFTTVFSFGWGRWTENSLWALGNVFYVDESLNGGQKELTILGKERKGCSFETNYSNQPNIASTAQISSSTFFVDKTGKSKKKKKFLEEVS